MPIAPYAIMIMTDEDEQFMQVIFDAANKYVANNGYNNIPPIAASSMVTSMAGKAAKARLEAEQRMQKMRADAAAQGGDGKKPAPPAKGAAPNRVLPKATSKVKPSVENPAKKSGPDEPSGKPN